MRIVIVHASKYGSTREIAEFIAEKLGHRGLEAEAQSAGPVPDLEGFGAVVVGSAVYMGHWMPEAVDFVQRNRAVLADRPVWLFSSGPLQLAPGDSALDDPELVPTEIPALIEAVHAREHRIFFGALDPAKLAFKHRALRKLPAARAILPEGDFRNWHSIEAWANDIARALQSPGIAVGSGGR
ncbi:MAG TPA: protoporphyrinogen oxidase [Thermoplasmata archaeon]|nr:protoporphyrinogen oxidase [Thermoplasmata archaeon]